MHKPTKVVTNDNARKAILAGVNAIYEPVKLTLGHGGGNALLYGVYGGSPRITNDGVTIAECIEPKDEIVQQVAQSFREACSKTNQKAGDATTTTTVIAGVLANAILDTTRTAIGNQNQDMMPLRKSLLADAAKACEMVTKAAKKCESLEELEKVAIVSVEDESIGKMVAAIVWEIGVDGFVDVKESFKGTIEHEIINGMRFPAKVPHKAFVTHPERYEMQMTDTPVLVTNYEIDNTDVAVKVVNNFFNNSSQRKITLLSPNFSEQVLIQFAQAAKNGYFVYPVKVPSLRTEQFEDICAYFGATFIDKQQGLELAKATIADYGFVEKLVVKDVEAREDAIAIGGKGATTDAVSERIEKLRGALQETKVESHRKLLERRIASLASSVASIKVGASSEAELKYLKLKVDDAVYACRGALKEGYVPGGGIALRDIAEQFDGVFAEALRAPHEQIKRNLGVDTLEISEDIIDNAYATRLAIEHAVSVVAHLITTKIIVAERVDESPAEGYNAIAKELNVKNRLFAKREGLLKENDAASEGAYDRLYEEQSMS